MRRLLLVGIVLLLGACAPVAEVVRDAVERPEGGARLTLVVGAAEFNAGASAALGVKLSLDGANLATDDARCQPLTPLVLECSLGDVTGAARVAFTGENVLAAATFRRAGGSTVYLLFDR